MSEKKIDEGRLAELLEKEAQLLKRKEREKKYWKKSYYRQKLMKEKMKELKITISDEEVEKEMKK